MRVFCNFLTPVLILLSSVACVREPARPASPTSAAPQPVLASPTALVSQPVAASPCAPAAEEDDSVDEGCPGEVSDRYPAGGLPQVLPTPGSASSPPAESARVETVADGLSMPLGLAWTPDGRTLFFSEVKLGQIRVMRDGVLQPQPFVALPTVTKGETGMLGLVVDPEYANNHYVYAYHSEPKENRDHLLRFEDRDGRATNQKEILTTVSISQGGNHNGGRLAFGPDGMLYLTVGNSTSTRAGQDPCRVGGKVLRLDRNGGKPADRPFACEATFALGFRNPFGLAIHPLTGSVFVTDNGGRGHDELDFVVREGNYGHPIVEGAPGDPRFVDPIWESGVVSIGPTGLAFYTGDRLPEFKNDLFFCGFHTGQLSRVRLAAPNFDRVEAMNVEIMRDQVDCRLDVANGPDGALYFTNFAKIQRITR